MRRWRRRRRWLVMGVVIFGSYIAVVIVFQSLQNSLIFPGAMTQGAAEAQVQPNAGEQLVSLATSTGDRVAALFGKAAMAGDEPRPTVLFFYGNGMCLAASQDLAEWFRALGFDVLVPEYVGYGMSDGEPSEPGCYATADAAYDWLIARGVDPQRLIVVGWSLGGAVAIDLAARKPVAGLMVLSAFTSLVEMAKAHYAFLPVERLLKHRFESETKISQVHCPTVIGYGDADTLVPGEMSQRLAKAAGGTVELFRVAGASHNDFFSKAQRQVAEHLRALAARRG
ncbi:MAG TPA: alpha/beta hydrolase [Pirellulales bacterium]|nr:alpha/beta hydrolase [Pirellulales bacterium]